MSMMWLGSVSIRSERSESKYRLTGREGFSLPELIIGITLFISLSAVVLPAVVTQIKKGDVSALAKEIDAITASVSSFYVDVARYPSEVNQLVYDPDEQTTAEDNSTQVDALGFWDDNSGMRKEFPNGRIKRWDGPYLNKGYVPASGGITTTMNGKIQRDFVQVCTGGKRYLAIEIADIAIEDARELSTFRESETLLGPIGLYDRAAETYNEVGPADALAETDAGLVRWYDPDLGAVTGNGDGVGNVVLLVTAVGSPGCSF